MSDPVARLNGVSVTYRRGREVLADVSWEAPAHPGLVVLAGPSGSGKTTILHLLTGMIRPSQGSVETLGLEVTSAPRRELRLLRRDRIGHVFQDFRLVPELTAVENVALPLWLQGIPGASAHTRALSVLTDLELAWAADRRPGQLSGGEQQRIALARALVTQPQLILADEPTANLDDASAAVVAAQLRSVVNEQRAVIVATHDRRLWDSGDLVFSVSKTAISR